MKLIVGLGNPGEKYSHTRHNAGWLLLDALAASWGATFADRPKFFAHVAAVEIDGEKVILMKSKTFYNETGRAVRIIMDFYKLTVEDVLVVHDDMALPFGTIRTRMGGSDAGNNGIKSITTHIGESYARIRVGIWNTQRQQIDAVDFVLGRFGEDERHQFSKLADICGRLAEQFVDDRLVPDTIVAI